MRARQLRVRYLSSLAKVRQYCGPKVLVLYLKRPRAKSWELRRCVGGASDTAT